MSPGLAQKQVAFAFQEKKKKTKKKKEVQMTSPICGVHKFYEKREKEILYWNLPPVSWKNSVSSKGRHHRLLFLPLQ